MFYRGKIEAIEVGIAFTFVTGWVAAQDGSRVNPPLSIVYDGCVVGHIERLFFRDDLLGHGIADGYASFGVAVDVVISNPASLTLTDHNGVNILIIDEDTLVVDFVPRGKVEEFTSAHIIGWVFNPLDTPTHHHSYLLVNQKYRVRIDLDVHRSDIPYTSVGDSPRGFSIAVSEILRRSKKELARFIDGSSSSIQVTLISSGHAISTLRQTLTANKSFDEDATVPDVKTHYIDVNINKELAAVSARPIMRASYHEPKVQGTSHQSVKLQAETASVDSKDLSIHVLAWDMSHNPVGRAFVLGEMCQELGKVELSGPVFSRYGDQLWEPLRTAGSLSISTYSAGDSWKTFLEAAFAQIESVNPDIVYVSKPRFPSLLIGLMFKVFKKIPLVVDIDDHELSFFGTDQVLSVRDAVRQVKLKGPEFEQPYGELWTRVSESLLSYADARTVSNYSLNKRFGGIVVRHARDERKFIVPSQKRLEQRKAFGIKERDLVVAFIGTPREHKGIFRVAEAIRRVGDDRLVLVVVGTFSDARLKNKLRDFVGARIKLFENQPFENLATVTSISDAIALLQDVSSKVSEYQIPAKLTDALALGVAVICTRVPPMSDLIEQGLVTPITTDLDLDNALRALVAGKLGGNEPRSNVISSFKTEFSYKVNAARIALAFEEGRKNFHNEVSRDLKTDLHDIFSAFDIDNKYVRSLVTAKPSEQMKKDGFPVVFFWKQNDTGIYGRRSDMIIKYLLASGRVSKIIHFDRAMSIAELDKNLDHGPNSKFHQGNMIYANTVKRVLRLADSPRLISRTFLYDDSEKGTSFLGRKLPNLNSYVDFVRMTLIEEGVDSNAVVYVCPTIFEFPELQRDLKFETVVCDLIDDQRRWNLKPKYREKVENNYADIIKMSTLILANCEAVKEGFSWLSQDIQVVPNGAEIFEDDLNWKLPAELARLKGPIVGYVGNLRDRINVELLRRIAIEQEAWNLVLIGSAHDAIDVIALGELPNVHLLGVKPYEEALDYIAHFDVAIMPHLDNEVSRFMNPLKMYVYMSVGTPIVATKVQNIQEVSAFANIASSDEDFIHKIAQVLNGAKERKKPDHKKALLQMSWTSRVEKILNLLCERALK